MSVWSERPIVGTRPSQRGGHSTAVITLGSEEGKDSHALVVIGGADPFGMAYNDVHILEVGPRLAQGEYDAPMKGTVLQPQAPSCPFTARMGHSAHGVTAALAAKMAAVAANFPSGATVEEVDDEKGSSTAHASEGGTKSSSAPLSSSTADSFASPIVIFGGMSMANEGTVHNDVWLLRVATDYAGRIEADKSRKIRTSAPQLVSWERMGGCTGDVPPPRHSHAACVSGDELFVLGGSDDNHPLEDGYALNLVTRVWRRLDLSLLASSPSTVATSSSAVAQSFAGREMASMAAHPCAAGLTLLAGGRDGDGLMLGDALAVSTAAGTATSNNTNSDFVLTTLCDDERYRRCCHTVVPSVHAKLGPVFLCVGGFTPSGMPLEDTMIAFTQRESKEGGGYAMQGPPVAVPRKLARKPSDELHFGLGHSTAAYAHGGGGEESLRSFVVMGIVPNAVGGSMGVYELLPGAVVAAGGASASSSAPVASAVEGLL